MCHLHGWLGLQRANPQTRREDREQSPEQAGLRRPFSQPLCHVTGVEKSPPVGRPGDLRVLLFVAPGGP